MALEMVSTRQENMDINAGHIPCNRVCLQTNLSNGGVICGEEPDLVY